LMRSYDRYDHQDLVKTRKYPEALPKRPRPPATSTSR